ncbi:MAG: hypothetical protein KF905_13585 [Flavobacteriales bacterium]|nr:hypothetical protein [Flavobacteriales bacterium]
MYRLPALSFIALVLALSMLGSSCATLLSRRNYDIPVRSEPSGANYSITDRKGNLVNTGTTPDIVRLKASAGFFRPAVYRVELRKAEREPANALLVARVDGWYWVNIPFTHLIGLFLVDPVSGSMYTLRRQAVFEYLPLAQ